VNAARPSLAAKSREETGKHVARLRRQGLLPGVVYGHGLPSSNVTVDAHEFELFRKHTGANTLIDLVVDDGKPTPTIVHGVQIHPVTRRPLHVDLFAVRMTEELTVEVPIVTTGVAPAVDKDGGTLNHQLASVRIRALPDHLPRAIEISVDGLDDFEKAIHVRDLSIPPDVHLLTDPDEVVVRVLSPRVVEVEAPVVPAEAPAEPAAEAEAAPTES
jgi:large subunit ribosomal protein L25